MSWVSALTATLLCVVMLGVLYFVLCSNLVAVIDLLFGSVRSLLSSRSSFLSQCHLPLQWYLWVCFNVQSGWLSSPIIGSYCIGGNRSTPMIVIHVIIVINTTANVEVQCWIFWTWFIRPFTIHAMQHWSHRFSLKCADRIINVFRRLMLTYGLWLLLLGSFHCWHCCNSHSSGSHFPLGM
jgi:hypothetical protein